MLLHDNALLTLWYPTIGPLGIQPHAEYHQSIDNSDQDPNVRTT